MAPLGGRGLLGAGRSDGRAEGKIYGMRRRAVGVKSCGAWTPGSGACWREGIRAKSKIRAGWDQCHDCTITSERRQSALAVENSMRQHNASVALQTPLNSHAAARTDFRWAERWEWAPEPQEFPPGSG